MKIMFLSLLKVHMLFLWTTKHIIMKWDKVRLGKRRYSFISELNAEIFIDAAAKGVAKIEYL